LTVPSKYPPSKKKWGATDSALEGREIENIRFIRLCKKKKKRLNLKGKKRASKKNHRPSPKVKLLLRGEEKRERPPSLSF